MKVMKTNPNFIPCLPVPGDEMLGGFPFNWHITNATEWIQANRDQVELSVVKIGPPGPGADSPRLDEDLLPKADLTRPIIMVRMRPEFFRLIDGNHRVAKARRTGVKELPAYYLTQEQHRQFFTSEDMDKRYVEYWNGKLKDFKKDNGRWGVVGEVEV